jgi:hypothetical protein
MFHGTVGSTQQEPCHLTFHELRIRFDRASLSNDVKCCVNVQVKQGDGADFPGNTPGS